MLAGVLHLRSLELSLSFMLGLFVQFYSSQLTLYLY